MSDQPVPNDRAEDEPDPPLNRAQRRAQRHGKQAPTAAPTPPARSGGRPVPLPPRRSRPRGNR